jgi:hypothetical protein
MDLIHVISRRRKIGASCDEALNVIKRRIVRRRAANAGSTISRRRNSCPCAFGLFFGRDWVAHRHLIRNFLLVEKGKIVCVGNARIVLHGRCNGLPDTVQFEIKIYCTRGRVGHCRPALHMFRGGEIVHGTTLARYVTLCYLFGVTLCYLFRLLRMDSPERRPSCDHARHNIPYIRPIGL